MSISALLLFAGVYFAAVATPGPGIAALVGRVLGQGLAGVAPYIAGFVVGDVLWLCVAGTGLTVIAHQFAGVFAAIKYAGAAYLLFVAFQLATSSAPLGPDAAGAPQPGGWRAFLSALSLTLGNPKVMVFFLSIMPLVVDLNALTPQALGELIVICSLIISATLAAYALAANQARAFLRSTRAVRLLRRAVGALLAGVALDIATR